MRTNVSRRGMIILALVISSMQVSGQPPRKLTQSPDYELVLEDKSAIIAPPHYDAKRKYPLVIFLPFTGGTAEAAFSGYVPFDGDTRSTDSQLAALQRALFGKTSDEKSFFVMLPPGLGSTDDHSWQGFEACIFRYENRLLKDIKTYGSQYSIDSTRIILVGYSLGGDLGWAISQRYPEKFKGAIISGTSCGYAEKGMMARQAKNHVRYAMAMGESEIARRTTGMNAAKAQLDKAGIRYTYSNMPGEHVPSTLDQLREGLNFIAFEDQ